MDPGFEIGGCTKCARKLREKFFNATLTFGHLGHNMES